MPTNKVDSKITHGVTLQQISNNLLMLLNATQTEQNAFSNLALQSLYTVLPLISSIKSVAPVWGNLRSFMCKAPVYANLRPFM